MKKLLASNHIWNQTCVLLTISLSFLLVGCVSTKVKDPRKDGELLNNGLTWTNPPRSIHVNLWGGKSISKISSYSLSANQDTAYKNLSEAMDTARYPKHEEFKNDEQPNGKETEWVATYQSVTSVVNYAEVLSSAINRAGFNEVNINPDYYVSGTWLYTGIGGGSLGAGWLVWDLIMAVPSIVLPVPLGGINSCTIEVTIYDKKGVQIDSRMLVDVDVSLVMYSIWSAGGATKKRTNAIADAAAFLVIEMIKEHENR